MPKIRDLGINKIPETARPLEIGGGAACTPSTGQCVPTWGGCTPSTGPCIPTWGNCTPSTGQCIPTWGNCTPSTGPPSRSGLTAEAIAQLKQQLHDQLQQLDELEKAIGPQTAEEIDAREKQLKAELEKLAKRRAALKKK